MREVASHTTVGLKVHQRKLTACCAELTRTDKTAAMLQSMGVMLQADKDSDDRDADPRVSAKFSEGKSRQNKQKEGERLAKLAHAAKVQQACARSTLEACVTRRENLVELARKSLEAVAKTIPRVDATGVVGVLDMTVLSNSVVSGYTSDSTCNSDLMEAVDQGTSYDDSMLLKRQISDSTLDVSIGISQNDSDTSSTNPVMTSESAEEECGKNPFDIDCAEVESITNQPLEPASENQGAGEWANNPLTQDFAKAADAKHEEHIPNEYPDLKLLPLTPLAKLIDQSKVGSTRSPLGEPPVSL